MPNRNILSPSPNPNTRCFSPIPSRQSLLVHLSFGIPNASAISRPMPFSNASLRMLLAQCFHLTSVAPTASPHHSPPHGGTSLLPSHCCYISSSSISNPYAELLSVLLHREPVNAPMCSYSIIDAPGAWMCGHAGWSHRRLAVRCATPIRAPRLQWGIRARERRPQDVGQWCGTSHRGDVPIVIPTPKHGLKSWFKYNCRWIMCGIVMYAILNTKSMSPLKKTTTIDHAIWWNNVPHHSNNIIWMQLGSLKMQNIIKNNLTKNTTKKHHKWHAN